MISAPKSGSGKTTVTAALLGALKKRGKRVRAYKSGPDYIDPMFHSFITGAAGKNLDSYMCSENTVKYLYADSFDGDIAVIEGAMGYYDGIGSTSRASAYENAKITGAPVILVIEPQGAALSAAALVKGFCDFHSDSNIKGVILNNIKGGMYGFYKDIIENAGVRVFGYLPHIDGAEIKSRHLGLFTAGEISDLGAKLDLLADKALETIDIDGICALAQTAAPVEYDAVEIPYEADVTIGVAKDNAFCFYYDDNLRILEKLGAHIKYVSPLSDTDLGDIDGLYIGGGYPESYAQRLSQNKSFITSVRSAAADGMPIYAECGGFMYLLERYCENGCVYNMCGVIDGESEMGEKLCRFGYIELTADEDCIICSAGEKVRGHEFHYSDSNAPVNAFTARRPNGRSWKAVYSRGNICAGYPHIYFYSNTETARRFVKSCAEYKAKK